MKQISYLKNQNHEVAAETLVEFAGLNYVLVIRALV